MILKKNPGLVTGITTHKISLISILETIIFLETNSSPEKNRRNQSCEKEAIVSRELKNRTFRKQHWRNEDLSLKLLTRVFCMKLVCLQYHNVERQPPSTLFSRYRSRQSALLKTKKFETTWAGEKLAFGLHIDTLMGSGSHTEVTLSTGLNTCA